jgi:hypothetical protein
VVRAFQQAKVPEPTYFETLELARAAARSSLDAKVVEVAVGPLDPGTAKLLLAERVARTGDDKSAVALLVEGFGLARASVWVDKRALLQALALVREIVGRSTWAADPLLAALETPFVLHMEDMARHRVAIWLSSRAQNATCAAVSGDPRGFPWEQKALEERVACLTRVGSPALPAAQADLGRFVRQAPTPVGGR